MALTSKVHPFSDESASKVPAEPGAYELLYNGTVVYIGSSGTSIRSRIIAHRKRKTFIRVTGFRYKKVLWRDDALELEAKLCSTFRKKSGGKPPRLQERTPKYRKWFEW